MYSTHRTNTSHAIFEGIWRFLDKMGREYKSIADLYRDPFRLWRPYARLFSISHEA